MESNNNSADVAAGAKDLACWPSIILNMLIERCQFIANKVENRSGKKKIYSGRGGVLTAKNSNVTIRYSNFIQNSAQSTGGAV